MFKNKTNNIDLHIHSNKSDGVLTGKEIIDVAVNNNLEVISIADHDTVDVYNDELFNYAKSVGIKLIKGVELSTKYKNVNMHILGYNVDINDENFKNELKSIRDARKEYLEKIYLLFTNNGYVLDIDTLSKLDSVTKGHISNNVISNEKNNDLLMKMFNKIPSKGEFIEKLMNYGCPYYVERKDLTPKEGADIIRRAKGEVVLAHPVVYLKRNNLTLDDIYEVIREINPNGIEANYLFYDTNGNLHEEVILFNEIANELNLYVTKGSDFHEYNKGIEIGMNNYSNILERVKK